MRREYILALIVAAVLLLAYKGYEYRYVRHEPTVVCNADKSSCTFTYTLWRLGFDWPYICVAGVYNLGENVGTDTNFMPYPKRDHEYITVQELRSEADARADMIEFGCRGKIKKETAP